MGYYITCIFVSSFCLTKSLPLPWFSSHSLITVREDWEMNVQSKQFLGSMASYLLLVVPLAHRTVVFYKAGPWLLSEATSTKVIFNTHAVSEEKSGKLAQGCLSSWNNYIRWPTVFIKVFASAKNYMSPRDISLSQSLAFSFSPSLISLSLHHTIKFESKAL